MRHSVTSFMRPVYTRVLSLLVLRWLVCSNGVGRTGTFCAVYVAIDELNQGSGFMPLPELVGRLRRHRRSSVQYKEQLQFCYEAILCYAQDLLVRRELCLLTHSLRVVLYTVVL